MSEKLLMTQAEMDTALEQIARKIVQTGHAEAALVGIRSRGVPLAHWIARHLETLTGKPSKVGALDINLYRDDLSEVGSQPVLHKTEIPFRVDGLGIILVDDVLYTGRTIRAAMDALVDLGRPRYIQLAVLVDRGWRELPIQADFTGKTVETKADEVVKVMTEEHDGKNQVLLKEHFSKRE